MFLFLYLNKITLKFNKNLGWEFQKTLIFIIININNKFINTKKRKICYYFIKHILFFL